MTAGKMDLDRMKSNLVFWLKEKMPDAAGLSVSDIEKPGVGLSNETLLFDIKWQENGKTNEKSVVLRKAPETTAVFPEYDIFKQFKIMQLLKDTEVPVSNAYWYDDDVSIVGAPFFLMDRVEGRVPTDFPPYVTSGFVYKASPDARRKMWLNGVKVMADIHRLDWKRLGFSFLGSPGRGTAPIDSQIAYWEHFFEWAKDTPDESHPIIEASLKWLKKDRYEPEHVGLCWGDPKLSNLMFDDAYQVKLVMDWEMANISDPESDLSFYHFLDWQHTEGSGNPRLEGIPDREETNQYWEEMTGYRVKNLLYNDVFAACRFGIILVSIFKNFRKQGVSLPDDIELNNASTQRLAMLLDLDPPAPMKKEKKIDEITLAAQIRFTGPSGFDWYIVSDRGMCERHEGLMDNPDCTMSVSVEVWREIQRGNLKFQDAWTDGKCKVEGDTSTMLQLKDKIAELSGLD